MSYWLDRLDSIIEREKNMETLISVERIPSITLSEFANCEKEVEIYSVILGCNIWFCPNDEFAAQIIEDDPEAVCYTPAELESLISLRPGPDSLKRIHDHKIANLSRRAMKTTKKTDGGVSIES